MVGLMRSLGPPRGASNGSAPRGRRSPGDRPMPGTTAERETIELLELGALVWLALRDPPLVLFLLDEPGDGFGASSKT